MTVSSQERGTHVVFVHAAVVADWLLLLNKHDTRKFLHTHVLVMPNTKFRGPQTVATDNIAHCCCPNDLC